MGAQGVRSFDVKGLLDHTQPIPTEAIQATYNVSRSITSFRSTRWGSRVWIKARRGQGACGPNDQRGKLAGRAEIRAPPLTGPTY